MSRKPAAKITLKGMAKRLLARFGFYLGRYPQTNTLESHLTRLLSALRIDCVFDVGAHEGEFGEELRMLGYQGQIVSFEPVPAHFDVLARRCAADAKWQAHQYALGAEDGSFEINVFSGTTFSSFLSPSEYGRGGFGGKLQVERTETVEVKRLKDVFDDLVASTGLDDPRVFLKLDTQGYDIAVIEGAGTKLERIYALQTELSVKSIYDGMSTGLTESLSLLQQRGFEVTGLFPVTWDPQDRLSVVEFDCVLCRTPVIETTPRPAAPPAVPVSAH